MLNFRNYSDLVRDTLKLAPALKDVDAIVGVPRSGMFPAAVLATHLGKPLGMISDDGGVDYSRSGARLNHVSSGGPMAFVDDSVDTGAAMQSASGDWIKHGNKVVRACVYLTPGAAEHVDHYAEVVPGPRIFEWNLFNSRMIEGALLDIDGVLCPDPPMMEDATEAYEAYIASAPVLYKPARKVAGIATNRLERYRDVTEAWLAANGIEHGGLFMAPFETAQARRRLSSPSALKAAWFDSTTCGLLIESHDHIARQVSSATGRPVISVESMRCFQ